MSPVDLALKNTPKIKGSSTLAFNHQKMLDQNKFDRMYIPALAGYIFWREASELNYEAKTNKLHLSGQQTMPPGLDLPEGLYLVLSQTHGKILSNLARSAHHDQINTIRLSGSMTIQMQSSAEDLPFHAWKSPLHSGVAYLETGKFPRELLNELRERWNVASPYMHLRKYPQLHEDVARHLALMHHAPVKMAIWVMDIPGVGEVPMCRIFDRDLLQLRIDDPLATSVNPPEIELPPAEWRGWKW